MPILPIRTYGIGAGNTAYTLSSPAVIQSKRTWLTAVYITYSANVSVSGTVTINSGLDAAYDVLLATLVFASERYGVYLPEQPVPLALGDVVDVLAPAGGGTITAAVEIKVEHEYPHERMPA